MNVFIFKLTIYLCNMCRDSLSPGTHKRGTCNSVSLKIGSNYFSEPNTKTDMNNFIKWICPSVHKTSFALNTNIWITDWLGILCKRRLSSAEVFPMYPPLGRVTTVNRLRFQTDTIYWHRGLPLGCWRGNKTHRKYLGTLVTRSATGGPCLAVLL